MMQLDKEDVQRLHYALAEMSEVAGFQQTLERLLREWKKLVDRVEQGYDFCIYNYENDLDKRALLERLELVLSEQGRAILAAELAADDARFRALTRPMEERLTSGAGESGVLPWYNRVPLKPEPELARDMQRYGL